MSSWHICVEEFTSECEARLPAGKGAVVWNAHTTTDGYSGYSDASTTFIAIYFTDVNSILSLLHAVCADIYVCNAFRIDNKC